MGVGKCKGRARMPGRRSRVSKGTEGDMSRVCLADNEKAGRCQVAVEDTVSQRRGSEHEGHLKSGKVSFSECLVNVV